jgi:hypothetical protein
MHEMILMPVAEPNGLHPGAFTQLNEPFSVRGRINQYPRAFDINGMAVGIFATVFTGNEPYRPKMLLFLAHLVVYLIRNRIMFGKKTVEKSASERLMENVHPAGFAAGRNPEE